MNFRYRKWDLGNGIVLVCRCEHDAGTYGPNGELQLMNIKSLNEWDSRVSFILSLCNCVAAVAVKIIAQVLLKAVINAIFFGLGCATA